MAASLRHLPFQPYVWNIAAGEALFVNDQLVLTEGDVVDIDGDGTPDPGHTLVNLTGISAMSMSDRTGSTVSVYVTADVEADPARREPVEFEAYVVTEVGLTWDGRNASGRLAAPGVYFARSRTAEGVITARIVRGR